MKQTWRGGRWLIILPPLIFLLIFFLIPFAFAFKISFAEALPRVPPFSDVISFTPAHHLQLAIHLGKKACHVVLVGDVGESSRNVRRGGQTFVEHALRYVTDVDARTGPGKR